MARSYGKGSDVRSPCSHSDHAIDRTEVAISFVESLGELGGARLRNARRKFVEQIASNSTPPSRSARC